VGTKYSEIVVNVGWNQIMLIIYVDLLYSIMSTPTQDTKLYNELRTDTIYQFIGINNTKSYGYGSIPTFRNKVDDRFSYLNICDETGKQDQIEINNDDNQMYYGNIQVKAIPTEHYTMRGVNPSCPLFANARLKKKNYVDPVRGGATKTIPKIAKKTQSQKHYQTAQNPTPKTIIRLFLPYNKRI